MCSGHKAVITESIIGRRKAKRELIHAISTDPSSRLTWPHQFLLVLQVSIQILLPLSFLWPPDEITSLYRSGIVQLQGIETQLELAPQKGAGVDTDPSSRHSRGESGHMRLHSRVKQMSQQSMLPDPPLPHPRNLWILISSVLLHSQAVSFKMLTKTTRLSLRAKNLLARMFFFLINSSTDPKGKWFAWHGPSVHQVSLRG